MDKVWGLEFNNYELDVDEDILENTVMETASGNISKDELINCFRNNTKKVVAE